MNFVNLVDTRNFEEKQVIRLTDTFEDRHITGITFSPDSAKIFACISSFLF